MAFAVGYNVSDLDIDNLDLSNLSYSTYVEGFEEHKPAHIYALKVILFVPILFLSVIGNSLMITLIIKHKSLRSYINILLGNMALCDLLASIFVAWAGLAVNLYTFYPLGPLYCKIESFLKFLFLFASTFSLLVLSADRLTRVLLPFRQRVSVKQALITCLIIWFVSTGISSPLISWRTYEERKWADVVEKWCWESKQQTEYYWIVLIVILIYVPALIMLINYSIILCQMGKFQSRLGESGNPATSVHRKKIIKMIFVYLLVAIICWTPLQFLVFYRRTCKKALPDWYPEAVFWQHLFASLNSAINPLIYGILNESFRRAMCYSFPFLSFVVGLSDVSPSSVQPNYIINHNQRRPKRQLFSLRTSFDDPSRHRMQRF